MSSNGWSVVISKSTKKSKQYIEQQEKKHILSKKMHKRRTNKRKTRRMSTPQLQILPVLSYSREIMENQLIPIPGQVLHTIDIIICNVLDAILYEYKSKTLL